MIIVEQNAYMGLEASDYCYVLASGQIVRQGLSKDLRNDDDIKRVYVGVY